MNLWTAITPFPAAGVGVASTLNPTGQLDIPMPSVITAGDLLMLSVSHHGTDWLTPAAGWTLVGRVLSGAIRCEVYWRRATGSEGATITVLCPQAPVAIGQVNSLDGLLASGNPIITMVTQANASGVTGCAQLTGLPEHALIYASIAFQVSSIINPSNSFHNASADPSGYSGFTNATGSGSSDLYGNATAGLGIRAGEVLLAGDTGAFVWSQTTPCNNAIVIVAVQPEPLPPTAPPNAQPTTATEFTTLPTTITQSAHDAGITYTVWFKYTAIPGDNVVGFWAKGQDYVTYQPQTRVYRGIEQVIEGAAFIITGTNNVLPVMVQVTPGETYYFECVTNTGNPSPATLTVNLQRFAQTAAPIGSIIIPGDSDGDTVFPLSVISGTTDQLIHQFRQDFPHGEAADVLLDGSVLVYDLATDLVNRYSAQLDFIAAHADVPIVTPNIRYVRTCPATNRWWIAAGTFGTTLSARYMNADGTLGPLHVATGTGGAFSAMAVNNAETILYFKLAGAGVAVKRVDLLTDTVTTDFVGANGTFRINDLLVLADDSLVVLYYKTGATFPVELKIYSAAGATLQTIVLGAAWNFYFGFAPRLAQAIDPGQFWFWGHSNSSSPAGQAIFYRIDAATGAILQTIVTTDYQFGVSFNGEIDPPTNRFGISTSCPFWVGRSAISAPPGPGGTIIVVKVVDPDSDGTTFGFSAGGGLSPSLFTLTHGQTQVFSAIPAGSGYSIAEAAAPGFTTEITVSNGSSPTNISVADGETVTVTVVNTAGVAPPAPGCPDVGDARISGYPRFS